MTETLLGCLILSLILGVLIVSFGRDKARSRTRPIPDTHLEALREAERLAAA
jgi:hypothetical protein